MIDHVKCIERFKKLVADFRALTLKKKKKKENTKSSKRNCLDIEVITKGVEQQKRLLSIEKLNLALSSLMKKN